MADQQAVVDESAAGQAEMDARLAALRSGYEAERYPSAAVRMDRLSRLWSALDRHADRLCEALSEDFGYRSPRQSYFADVATTGKAIRLARKGVRRWMRPERRRADFPFSLFGGRCRVHYQPLGVVGILSPWNIPVNLTLTPLAGVLAAGNRALVKPSEHTPHASAVMVELLDGAFDRTEVATVTGDAAAGQYFSALPLDHLVFTGGTAIARHIMRAAADNLTPLTLELGGKSPVIIGTGADLDRAAACIAFGKVFNAGQVCLAPDYALVPEDARDALVAALQREVRRMLPDGAASGDYVAVINQRQRERIGAYLDECRQAGVDTRSDGAHDGARVPVTLIIDPPDHLRVSREEIFGPLLIIRTYRRFDDALAHVNARPRALALYFFGRDAGERRRVLEETTSGGVTLDDVIMHYTFDDLPFGGVGPSGMGAYHGFDGFRQFSNARAVYRQTRVDLGRVIRPPYGPVFDRFSRFLMTRG